MCHSEVIDDSAIFSESVETGPGDLEATDHGDVIGNGQQQRSTIGIAATQERVDLEHGTLRVGGIDHPAVVDDVFEHRESSDAHQSARSRVVGSMSE